jgi:hypothetical protein
MAQANHTSGNKNNQRFLPLISQKTLDSKRYGGGMRIHSLPSRRQRRAAFIDQLHVLKKIGSPTVADRAASDRPEISENDRDGYDGRTVSKEDHRRTMRP